MSAAAHTAAPALAPDPLPDRVATAYAVRLLGFVHKLIDFGIQLAAAAQPRTNRDALTRLGVLWQPAPHTVSVATTATGPP